jgi:alpha-L-fucosidase 2
LGQLQEWSDDIDLEFEEHRHQSHLYSVYPGKLLMDETRKIYRDAAKKTLDIRSLDTTGWSTIWKIALNARLGEKQAIIPLLKKHISPVSSLSHDVHFTGSGTYPNLLCAHPPFQIDGNLGICGALLEVFIQQIEDHIILLPSLPDEWSVGAIKGYHLQGGGLIDFNWSDNVLNYVKIASKRKSHMIISNMDLKTELFMDENEVVELDNQLKNINL